MSDFDFTEPAPNGKKTFNANSAISVGVLIVMIGGIWELGSVLNGNKDLAKDNFAELKLLVTEQKGAFALQEAKSEAHFDRLERAMQDRWSASDMQRWAGKLGKQNPTINVPDVERSP